MTNFLDKIINLFGYRGTYFLLVQKKEEKVEKKIAVSEIRTQYVKL